MKTNNELKKLFSPSKLGFVAAAVCTYIALYFSTLLSLHQRWTYPNGNYSHGYLLLALGIYLIWQRCRYHPVTRQRLFVYSAVVTVLAANLLWLLGNTTQTQLLEQIALPAIAWSWLILLVPASRSVAATLPFFLFYLSVPLWDVLVYPLRLLTATAVEVSLSTLPLPIFMHNFIAELPSGTIAITDACSGSNYFSMALALGFTQSLLQGYRLKHSLLITGLLVALAVLGNWIRVLGLILVAYYTQMQTSLIDDHVLFGWLIFAVFFLFALYVTRRLPRTVPQATVISPPKQQLAPALGLLLVSISVPLAARLVPVTGLEQAADFRPPDGYTISRQPQGWTPAYRGYDRRDFWRVFGPSLSLDITLLSYYRQQQGKELIYFANGLDANKARLRVLDDFIDPRGRRYKQSIVLNDPHPRLVLWFYQVGPYQTVSPVGAKLLQLPARFSSTAASRLVTFSLPCKRAACGQALRRLHTQGKLLGELRQQLLQP